MITSCIAAARRSLISVNRSLHERMIDDFRPRPRNEIGANAAGADPTAEIGEDHDPETHLIPLVLDATCGHGVWNRLSDAGWGGCARLSPVLPLQPICSVAATPLRSTSVPVR